MPLTFAQADALFRQDKLNELVADAEGRRFLKLRSLNRTEYLERLFQTAGIARPEVGARQLFAAAFNAGINTAAIKRAPATSTERNVNSDVAGKRSW